MQDADHIRFALTLLILLGLWLLWRKGFAVLFLEEYRNRLFELRQRAFIDMIDAKRASKDVSMHLAFLDRINLAIRFAHYVTPMASLILLTKQRSLAAASVTSSASDPYSADFHSLTLKYLPLRHPVGYLILWAWIFATYSIRNKQRPKLSLSAFLDVAQAEAEAEAAARTRPVAA